MRSLIIAILSVMISGCATVVPLKQTFPAAPESLLIECVALKQHDSSTKLSVFLETVIENYGLYHECSIKQRAWINWYNDQKKIQEK